MKVSSSFSPGLARVVMALLGGGFALALHGADAVAPAVSNLQVSQRTNSYLVDIRYDLVDPDSALVRVTVELSSDAGATYAVPTRTLTGDFGAVAPGTNKHITWNAWEDWPGNVTTRGRVRLTLEDPQIMVFTPPVPTPRGDLVYIPPGFFTMGSPDSEQDRRGNEGPQRRVWISRGFWLGKHEVTQEEYQAVTGSNPSAFPGDPTRPVEQVSWDEATSYCGLLTAREQAAGRLPAGYVYRLPTEAEWEYACRAGTTNRFSYGDDPGYAKLGDYAWFGGNSGGTTHPVGTKLPNPWGLHDMQGNLWEWCQDWWAESYAGLSSTDPQGPPSGSGRVIRGGGWSGDGGYCRSAVRDGVSPGYRYYSFGFRVVLAPGQP